MTEFRDHFFHEPGDDLVRHPKTSGCHVLDRGYQKIPQLVTQKKAMRTPAHVEKQFFVIRFVTVQQNASL